MRSVSNPKKAVVGDEPSEVFHSSLDGPIESLSFLGRSLLFAELARIAYLSRIDAGLHVHRMGFPEIRFYERDGAQAYLFGNRHDVVVTCRGTEPHDWNDWRADVDAALAVAETVGHVHRGFKSEVDELWPRLERALASNTRTLWFTGHSLGGAMATICAGRCKTSDISSNPRALFTFGSPRVGNRRYVNFVKLDHYRWVNNNDLVTQLPPSWISYRHAGQMLYLNSRGKLRGMTWWQRFFDRWRGFLHGLFVDGRFDHLRDHAIEAYVKAIAGAIAEREGSLRATNVSAKRFDPSEALVGPHFRRRQEESVREASRRAA